MIDIKSHKNVTKYCWLMPTLTEGNHIHFTHDLKYSMRTACKCVENYRNDNCTQKQEKLPTCEWFHICAGIQQPQSIGPRSIALGPPRIAQRHPAWSPCHLPPWTPSRSSSVSVNNVPQSLAYHTQFQKASHILLHQVFTRHPCFVAENVNKKSKHKCFWMSVLLLD